MDGKSQAGSHPGPPKPPVGTLMIPWGGRGQSQGVSPSPDSPAIAGSALLSCRSPVGNLSWQQQKKGLKKEVRRAGTAPRWDSAPGAQWGLFQGHAAPKPPPSTGFSVAASPKFAGKEHFELRQGWKQPPARAFTAYYQLCRRYTPAASEAKSHQGGETVIPGGGARILPRGEAEISRDQLGSTGQGWVWGAQTLPVGTQEQ